MLEYRVRIAVVAALAAIAAYAVHAAIGLYADGSFFLLEILRGPRFATYDPARIHSIYLTQFPVVLAMQAGVSDLGALIRLHSFGLQLPLLIWIGALILHLRSNLFWLFVGGVSVTVFTSGLFAVGEYNCAAALAAFGAAILLRPQPFGWTLGLLLLAAAIGLLRAYESAAFLGPLLIGIAAWRLWTRRDDARPAKAAMLLAIVLFAAATWIACDSILHPYRPRMLAAATSFRPLLRSGQVIYMALMASLLPLAFVLPPRHARLTAAAAILLSLVFLAIARLWIVPHAHYGFRALSAVLLFVVLAAAAFTAMLPDRLRPGLGAAISDRLALPAAACFVTLAIVFTSYLAGFRDWAARFEDVVANGRGVVPIERTALTPSPYTWEWSNPTLSVVLRGDGAGAVVANDSAYAEWQPFAPDDPPPLPLVRKHGRLYQ